MSDVRRHGPDPLALLVADVYEAAGVLRGWGDQIAAAEGQTQSRWQVLSVFSDGDHTVPSAAKRLGTSRQAVQKTVNDLIRSGLVHLSDNPRHRTSPYVSLTEEGRDVLAAINRRARVRHRAVVKQLTGVDLDSSREAIRELIAAVARDRARVDR